MMKFNKKNIKIAALVLFGMLACFLIAVRLPDHVAAVSTSDVTNTVNKLINGNNQGSSSRIVDTFVIMTLLSVIPLILIMTTSFTRIIVVLSFVRSSLGTQQNPPNQVLIGLALFLTLFTMRPVYSDIYHNAIQPYNENRITQQEVFDRSENRMKEFMYKQANKKDVKLFKDLDQKNEQKKIKYRTYKDIPFTVMAPAFILSELKTAFSIGFLLFIPFMIIDLVVASVLMSMGMIMLSPVMISLPFKILLFVLVDGWYLLVESLVQSFN
ncbi:flagellar type III secretion system pore protein FliP [Ligilactobacillus sp.]|uniref:flagellar type III secretion system pore protein FliP n=1 Tax=Ligilactobacillus sp. TaxID=2767921 RepID=UPI002FE059F6